MRLAFSGLVFVLLLAGCVKPESVPTPEASATPVVAAAAPAQNATGSLVVSTLFKDRSVLSDVAVTIGNRTLLSDAGGVARFDNLTAGSYNVTATKAAHRAAVALAQVEAGKESEVEVVLEAEVGSQHAHEKGVFAHRDTYRFDGHFDCSATYVIVTGDCMILLQNVSEQTGAPPPPNATTSKNVIEFPLDATWSQLTVEMSWDAPQTSVEQGMTLALEPAQAPADGHAAKYAVVDGPSPLRVTLKPGVTHETATAKDMPNPAGGEVIRARAFVEGVGHHAGGLGLLGVGFAKDQTFSLVVTVTYGL